MSPPQAAFFCGMDGKPVAGVLALKGVASCEIWRKNILTLEVS
jgi:hypothetical protein